MHSLKKHTLKKYYLLLIFFPLALWNSLKIFSYILVVSWKMKWMIKIEIFWRKKNYHWGLSPKLKNEIVAGKGRGI